MRRLRGIPSLQNSRPCAAGPGWCAFSCRWRMVARRACSRAPLSCSTASVPRASSGSAARAGAAYRATFLGQRQDGRDARRFGRAHRARIVAEIALRRGVRAIGADAGFGVVQIDFHDPPLAPDMLNQEGEPGLDTLPRIAAAVPQEGRLRRLLADGRSATDAPARGIALHRVLDRLEVEAVVLAEFAVLGGDC